MELLRRWSQEGIDAPETETYSQLQPGAVVEILEGAFSGSLSLVAVEGRLVRQENFFGGKFGDF